ncbi:PEP-CTERM sorting domain-containing protein [Phycisphaeraceae bacterium D3-23]
MRKTPPLLTALLTCVGTSALATPIVIDDSDGAPDYTETGPMGDAVNVTATNAYNGTARNPSIPQGTGPVTGTWTWTGLAAGFYDVAAHWSAVGIAGNLADNAPYAIVSDLDTVNVTANQQVASTADYLVSDDNNNPHEFQTLGQIEVGAGGQITLTLTGGVSPNPPDLMFEYYDAALVNLLLRGDLNDDGFVGAADLDLLMADWGSDDSIADADGNGTVGQGDLDIVIADWGQGTPPVTTVPEPGSLALLGLGGFVLMRRRRA